MHAHTYIHTDGQTTLRLVPHLYIGQRHNKYLTMSSNIPICGGGRGTIGIAGGPGGGMAGLVLVA